MTTVGNMALPLNHWAVFQRPTNISETFACPLCIKASLSSGTSLLSLAALSELMIISLKFTAATHGPLNISILHNISNSVLADQTDFGRTLYVAIDITSSDPTSSRPPPRLSHRLVEFLRTLTNVEELKFSVCDTMVNSLGSALRRTKCSLSKVRSLTLGTYSSIIVTACPNVKAITAPDVYPFYNVPQGRNFFVVRRGKSPLHCLAYAIRNHGQIRLESLKWLANFDQESFKCKSSVFGNGIGEANERG